MSMTCTQKASLTWNIASWGGAVVQSIPWRCFLVPRGPRAVNPNERLFMKFVSLRTKRTHRQGNPAKPSHATAESSANPTAPRHQIYTYAELRQQIHDDLRFQHPEWVQPDGTSPLCDACEARLMELLGPLIRRWPKPTWRTKKAQ